MAANLTTLAIVLRRTNYGEADRILTILTPKHGQQAVIARSVRKEKSKLAGGIELFAVCELGLVRSSTNADGMWTLTSSRIVTFYDQIMTDYDRLQFGYEVIKQISGLSNVIEAPELYRTLNDALMVLDNLQIDLRLVKAWFYLHLARLRGGELNLWTDSNGMKLVEGAGYDYETGEKVFVYVEGGGRYTTEIIKLLRLLNGNSATVLSRLGSIGGETISSALDLARIAAESS